MGGSGFGVVPADAARARELLRDLNRDAAAAWRELAFSASAQARFRGIGVLSADDAARFGAVGPVARASGVREDVRAFSPGLTYGGSFGPAVPRDANGDVTARVETRVLELEQCFEILDELLAKRIEPATAVPGAQRASIGLSRVESPRGETVCCVEAEGDAVGRLHLRTGSYANWPALAAAVSGELLPDFPLINKSFELCYACVDR